MAIVGFVLKAGISSDILMVKNTAINYCSMSIISMRYIFFRKENFIRKMLYHSAKSGYPVTYSSRVR